MKRILPVFIIALLGTVIPATAQVVQYGVASSPNVVGSGARALGVGGAFIAIADDATAASWNPAALIILERPEAAIMGSYNSRKINEQTDFFDFNYLAVSYPFTALGRNMIVSLNYQRLFDFNSRFSRISTDLAGSQFIPSTPVFQFHDPAGWDLYTISTSTQRTDFLRVTDDVTGDIGAIAPAFAIQITPKLSFGFTLNFWMDGLVNQGYLRRHNEFQRGAHQTDVLLWFDTNNDKIVDYNEWQDLNSNGLPDPGEGEVITSPGNANPYSSNASQVIKYDLFGFNANLGALWKATPKITVGAVYKAPFTSNMRLTFTNDMTETRVDAGSGEVITFQEHSESTTNYDLHFPAVYGLGVAYRLNDNFTAALDVSYTDWPGFWTRERANTGANSPPGPLGTGGADLLVYGPRRSAINGLNLNGYCDARNGPRDCGPGDPNWHSSVEVYGAFTARLGMEYLFILPKTIIPARLGFAYDPQPALHHPDDFYAVSAGTGAVFMKRFIFDIAYQYRWSNSATLATVSDYTGENLFWMGRGPVTENTVLLSSIVHF